MTKADRRAFDQWVAQNPLRAWRKANGVSIMEAAARLGASMTSVQLWEKGVNVPNDGNFAKIAVLVRAAGVKRRWADWYNRKPV